MVRDDNPKKRGGDMRSRRHGLLVTLLAAAALATAAAAGAADQNVIPYQQGDPHANGCPSGWEALDTGVLASYGYGAGTIDLTANGGNGDGIICGKPWTDAEQAARLPGAERPVIFDFQDNNLPPYAG
jgi:hypothetical protein